MQLIDTHTHLYLPEFDHDRQKVVAAARELGVERLYLPNIDRESVAGMVAMEEAFAGTCFAMMGLHPCSVGEQWQDDLKWVEEWLQKRSFAAVGEIGLDYYWDKTFIKEQQASFTRQVEWGRELNLPVVIHSRESLEDCIEIISRLQDGRLRGVFHCFGGSVEDAKRIRDLGFYLGIGGVLTYKKSGLLETMKHVSKEQIVLETDAPYLSPVPYRGKRNEPAYLIEIVQTLAGCWEEDPEATAIRTTTNALKLFGS